MSARRLLPLLLLVAGCASTEGRPGQDTLPGCYYFDRNDAAHELDLPWGIRLEPDSLRGWAMARDPDFRSAVTLTGSGTTAKQPFAYWKRLSEDSVEVGYPSLGSLALRLVITDRGFEGAARAVGDARLPGPVPTYPVSLMKAQCPDA